MLSAPVRLVILNQLLQAPRTVEQLSESTSQSMANVSQHLAKLKSAQLVTVRKQGLQRIYSLSSPAVQKVVLALQELAREISSDVVDAEDTLVAPELRATANLHDILLDVAANRADLIDVRTPQEQSATPVGLARQVPLESDDDLETLLQNTAKNKPVYVFCRGAYCVTASRATEYLRAKGIQAWCLRQTAIDLDQERESIEAGQQIQKTGKGKHPK
jgi:DNA-binding transcriptional ArsR family regulator/rhodanese-related sulfurtransferase